MEKAIDIKRRAQRCIQNGDLDGALKEYEKLIAVQDSDPYNFVLLADLHFKKGDTVGAAQRYVASIDAYEKAALYKNAIAVGKKMMRLSLSPTLVLQKLAGLHALDGLGTEAALYYQQYAEHLLRDNRTTEAADALRKGFEASPENVKSLERLADVYVLDGDNESAVRTLGEAAVHYQSAGLLHDADRCRVRASKVPGGAAAMAAGAATARPTLTVTPNVPADATAAPGGPPTLEVERSHMTSLADSGVATPPPMDIERTPSAPVYDAPLPAADINHSMDIAPVRDAESVGAPALEAPAEPFAPQAAPAPEPAEAAPAAADGAPGLRFGGPAQVPAAPIASSPPAPAATPAAPEPAAAHAESAETDAQLVERLLREAREQFKEGDRETAARTLVRAAKLYDDQGQFDSAATIYRNLGRSTHAESEVMTLWLRNCEARNDRLEAAQVACELGDRSLNDGDLNAARDWFRRANGLDANNETAKRRLAKLNDVQRGVTTETAPAEPAASDGRVEVAVGRSEAVTFDLGSLVSEFQRGVQTQISGDPQGHYDLAMAYREMGLLEQAIESFRSAGRDPAFAQRCAEMVGRSMLDQGRFEEAAQEFIVALELPGLSDEGGHDLRYQLGLAYEAAGRTEDALAEFERVYSDVPSYPDVALKIRALRQATGTG